MLIENANMEVNYALRSKMREDSKVSEHVRVSLQVCAPNNCEVYLSERISNFEREFHSSHENRAHVENLKGLRAVLQNLMANIEIGDKTVRLSYMNFNEALPCSFHIVQMHKKVNVNGSATEEKVYGLGVPSKKWPSSLSCAEPVHSVKVRRC